MTDEAKEDSKPEKPDIANPESDISMLKEVDTGTEPESDDESRKDNRMDEEDLDEDPDENPEEYVDEDDASDEENNEDKTADMEVKTTDEASDKMDDTKGSHDEEKSPDKNDKVDPKSVGKEGKDREEIGTEKKSFASGKDSYIDKELLLASKFFDQNQLEDMRVIIHNLRKFLSHRGTRTERSARKQHCKG